MKLRYSLRTMLILLTAVAVLLGLRLQPAKTAAAFQDAFNAGNFEAARQMVNSSALSPSSIEQLESWFQSFPDRPHYAPVRIEIAVYKQGVLDWLLGRCEGDMSHTVILCGATSESFHFAVKGRRIVMTGEGASSFSLAWSR